MNTNNEDEDNMDSTSNFQSAEEESKLTSNQNHNGTNNSMLEKDDIFYDIVNVDDNLGKFNDTIKMDTEVDIVPNQLGANSKYTSGTRQVTREIIKEGLSKSLRNAINSNDVEMSNSSNPIDINTSTVESNTPLQKIHTTTINTAVNDESSDVSSPYPKIQ